MTLRMQCATWLGMPQVTPSLDEWVGEEEHQCDDETVDRQGLHEGQGEEEHSAKIIRHLWLTGDAINAAARGNSLSDSRANGSKANGSRHRLQRAQGSRRCLQRPQPVQQLVP